MTMREIVDTMLAAYGVTEAVAKQYKDLQSGLRALLKSHVGKTVERAHGTQAQRGISGAQLLQIE